jgi:hypothetical protein
MCTRRTRSAGSEQFPIVRQPMLLQLMTARQYDAVLASEILRQRAATLRRSRGKLSSCSKEQVARELRLGGLFAPSTLQI